MKLITSKIIMIGFIVCYMILGVLLLFKTPKKAREQGI